jgi:Mrp family chromosome partitioning ATPase
VFRALSIMPSGAQPPNPVELMGRRELPALLADLRSQYDVVIVDTPSMEMRTGAEMIARACGSALVVARKNHTLVADAQNLTDALHSSGTKIVGTTLTDF